MGITSTLTPSTTYYRASTIAPEELQQDIFTTPRISAERIVPKPVTSDQDNVINVLAYFNAYPEASTRAAEYDLGISRCSIHKILRANNMHPYKFTPVSELHPNDAVQRMEFCEMILVKTQEDPELIRNIIWIDESKFTREGIFNRRNSHYWSSENPHSTRERNFQNKFSVNIFCLVKYNQLSFCIYEENLNTNRYLNIFVEDFLDELPLNQRRKCWYQLDGAPPHCGIAVDQQLNEMFEDRWIRRLGPWNWPAGSPDITPLDFYVWGTMKQRPYSTPVISRADLITRIRRTFDEWPPAEIAKATTDGCSIENKEVHVNFPYNRKCQTDAIILVRKIMSENP
ncbi:hypothetical protein NQ315_012018 [Exocentrus adspersus]|uniref:Tc1-like transposase DDE domain-containing protein n=1 Tax=Exocentrus adspersus TaxID=1586481 RepID=A0AAV8VIL8_9CUCU|nr:hypothetical protein NQ315_012018 [Exocentrus adspersus]